MTDLRCHGPRMRHGSRHLGLHVSHEPFDGIKMTTTYVALLRAINVGGTKAVAMPELRKLFSTLGFDEVQTLLQTGNVLFSTSSRSAASIEETLEEAARTKLKLQTQFFVRSAKDWRQIVAENPFPREATESPSKLATFCLKTAASAKAISALQASVKGPEVIQGRGKQMYAVYPNGMGRSKLTTAVVERVLDTSGTARNWNTVLKIDGALDAR